MLFRVGIGLTLLVALGAFAQQPCTDKPQNGTSPLRSFQARINVDSGVVEGSMPSDSGEVVFREVVWIKDAEWLRLQFVEVLLAGDPASSNASYLRLTSLKDGAVQTMHSNHVAQWQKTSAYFNGNAVQVEVIAFEGTGPNRLRMKSVIAGAPLVFPDTICGGADNRALSTDPRAARHVPEGCSTWLHNDPNRTFMTAGHCGISASDVQEFNVPLSTSGGAIVHPAPQDQYVVDPASVQFVNGGVGNDYCYFACFPNSTTGLTAYQAQGAFYIRSAAAPAVSGQQIRITGYGTTSSPVSPTWNQVQKTHVGPYFQMTGTTVRYQTDTTGGNSGSAVVNETNGEAIGIHTHGGCGNSGGNPTGSNAGTAIHLTALQNALANPAGLCRSGNQPFAPPVYASGDMNNNFGTVNSASGGFGRVAPIPAQIQGLAFNRNQDVFYAVANNKRLYSIQPDSGAATLLTTLTTAEVINGLGFDPVTDTLYGIAQSNGQLYVINRATGAGAAIGAPSGGTVGALDYDVAAAKLYGIDDSGGASKLVQINTSTGTKSVIGNLGTGIADCNGLGWNDRDGMLYSINAGNEQALRINPATGVATTVGATLGFFDVAYGLAVRQIASETVATFSYLITGGFYGSGNVMSLLNLDSDRLVVRGDEFNTSPMAEFTSNSSTYSAATKVEFVYTTRASRTDMIERGELWDWANGGWDPASAQTRAPTLNDSTVTITVTTNPSRFLEQETRRLKSKLSWVPTTDTDVYDGWASSINQIYWKVTP